MAVVNKMFLYL